MLAIEEYLTILKFTPDDITPEYAAWLYDEDVNKYLEVRFAKPSYQELQQWCSGFDFISSFLWKIVDQRNNLTIGTASLYGINQHHKFGHYGYLIGNKNYWGGSTAYSVVAQVFCFAFRDLGLKNIRAGAYANNIGAITNFLKLGMKPQGVRPKSLIFESSYVDEVLYGYSKEEWDNSEMPKYFSKKVWDFDFHV